MDGGPHGGFPLPLVIHPRVRKVVRRITAVTCFAVFASTGAAFAACPAHSAAPRFSKWGDKSNYFLVPGGSFEGTPAQVGWSLSNASLTAGNEPFYVNDSSDDQSLTISGGGSATSPFFCVDSSMSKLRFFAQQTAAGSDLKVQGLIKTWYGVIPVTVADLADGSQPSWAPVQQIATRSGLLPGRFAIPVALRFEVPGSAGSWNVDDAYVDPYRAG